MNFLDIIIAVLLIYAGWKGFKKGFIIELFTFLAMFLGLYAGIRFSDFVSEGLRSGLNFTSEYLPIISFVIVFLAVGAMVYFGGKMVEKFIKVVQLSLVNKLFGIFFSILKMLFIIGAAIILSESYDERNDVIDDKTKEGSLLFYPIKKMVTFTIPAFDRSTLFLKNTLLETEPIESEEDTSPDENQ